MKYICINLIASLLVMAAQAQEIKTYRLVNNTGMEAISSNYGARHQTGTDAYSRLSKAIRTSRPICASLLLVQLLSAMMVR